MQVRRNRLATGLAEPRRELPIRQEQQEPSAEVPRIIRDEPVFTIDHERPRLGDSHHRETAGHGFQHGEALAVATPRGARIEKHAVAGVDGGLRRRIVGRQCPRASGDGQTGGVAW